MLMQPKATANPICQSLKILTQAKLISMDCVSKQKGKNYPFATKFIELWKNCSTANQIKQQKMQRIKEIERIFCKRVFGKTALSVVHIYGNEANPAVWSKSIIRHANIFKTEPLIYNGKYMLYGQNRQKTNKKSKLIQTSPRK